MKTRTANANQPSVLTLEGRFDMDVQMRFRNAYRKLLAETPGSELVVDMGAVEYMDSSALGGLLLLREETGKRGIAVKLAGAGAADSTQTAPVTPWARNWASPAS